ncbi:hypothetical protein [Desulfobulbus oralis]|uniref:hypothetical protein n=1 Tax=Desulfobulbus oralis TaxID=1986146 RepID=UPI0011B03DF6|nr:hypothetical protein [Desulfobulbus oralis]
MLNTTYTFILSHHQVNLMRSVHLFLTSSYYLYKKGKGQVYKNQSPATVDQIKAGKECAFDRAKEYRKTHFAPLLSH